jgi:hypothetical protein
MTILGEAMRPVWRRVHEKLERPAFPTVPVGNMVGVASDSLHRFVRTIPVLSQRIDDLMRDVVANEAAREVDVYRSVGRFEAVVDDLLVDYRQIQSLQTASSDRTLQELLAGAFRHALTEIRDWLAELVMTLEDPVGAVKKRGLPTTGHVVLPLTLTLTEAPQIKELNRWVQHRAVPAASPSRPPLGFWGTVAAVALGWGIGNALFGDDDESV